VSKEDEQRARFSTRGVAAAKPAKTVMIPALNCILRLARGFYVIVICEVI